MKKQTPLILLFLICWILAIICGRFSVSVMDGYQDCRHIDSISHTIPPPPRPNNCAENASLSLLGSDVLWYCGIALFFLPFGVSAILFWRKEVSTSNEMQSIKNVS